MLGIDPKKLAEVQAVSKDIKGKIVVDFEENKIALHLLADTPEAQAMVHPLLNQFANALAQQLSAFFAIAGEIEQVGEPAEQQES